MALFLDIYSNISFPGIYYKKLIETYLLSKTFKKSKNKNVRIN